MPLSYSDCKRLAARAASLLLGLSTLFLWAPLAAQVNPLGVGPIVITVSDLDRAVSFYTDVLSFRQVGSSREQLDSLDRLTGIFGTNASAATLQLGSESIVLVQYHTPRGRPVLDAVELRRDACRFASIGRGVIC
jgi:hypothetical protein